MLKAIKEEILAIFWDEMLDLLSNHLCMSIPGVLQRIFKN